MHKINEPIRPIVASYGSVTSGSEDYLLSLIKPIREKCTFAVKSTGEFKKSLLDHRDLFNHEEHEISSFDAKSLFTSLNVNRVISYVLGTISKNSKAYLEKPKLMNMEMNIEMNIILKYSSFCTVSRYYKQIQGLSMGSRLSPILADLFVNLMDESII